MQCVDGLLLICRDFVESLHRSEISFPTPQWFRFYLEYPSLV